MEEGWTLEVKKVSAKSVKSAIEGAVEDADAIEEIKAFDITIYDKDGNAIQPDGSVQVSFSGTGIKGDAAEVYHVDDSKKKAEKVCDATTNSKVEFEAEHFSIYAVVGSNTVYANTRDTAYEVAKGDQLTLKSDNYKKDQEWKSDESSIVEVVDSGTTGWMNPQPYAIVEAKSEGTTFVKYNKEKFYITVTKANGTLSFDLNGGTGTKPADITGENGESVTLPTGNEITRENYTFLGWSTEKDANLVTSNGKAVVYPAGGTFEVSGKTTLYAVWAQSAGKLLGKIAIAIRKDGTIPGEPSLQYASYTFLTSSRGNSTLMSVDNVLDYINPAQTMVGKSNVESVLQPTFYSYVNNKNANGTYWNNATQYVEWYVVKYQNSDYAYHIDGVVRNKQNVYLDYDGNGYTDGLVPNGVQLVEGGSTTVSQAGNYYNGNSDWRDLKKAGYTFIGWNTSADGKGTSYQPGASITVRENTTLYAQWKAKGYTVKYDSDGGSTVADKNLKFADEVDVSATPTKDGYIFKGWYYNESEVKDATYASLVNDDESVQEITLKAKWQQKDGRFGYYLSLASADWKGGMPDNLEVSGTSGQGLPKYAEKVHYTYGDKYNVISNVPEAEGHAFIGWLDKKRGNQSAAIRTAGDELTYIYKAGDENQAYTLDALWASIAAKGGTYPYNGSSRQITADVAINEGLNLNAEYVEQAKKFIKTGKMEYSTDNKNWSEENPGFTDAGTYTVYVRQDVTVGGTTTTLQSSAQIVITPATITVTANNASKKYAEADPSEFTYSQSAGVNGETAGFAGRLERIAGEEVGHYAINQGSLVLADNGSFKAGNYTLSYVAGDFEIVNSDKLELTLAPYNNVYDGESHGIAVTKAVAGTEDVKLQYSKDGKTWQDDPITYKNVTNGAKTVYVKASAKGYDDKIVSETVTITPKTLTVTADNKVKKYGTADPKLTYQNENGVKTEVPGFEGKLEREAGEEVGHYDINQGSLTLKNNEDFKASNYELVYVKGDFEITKNDSLQLVVDPYNGTYDGHAHGVTVTTASAGKEAVTLQYSTDGSNWADKVEYIDVTNGAKTVYVKASAKGYDDKTVTSSITITPATITVTANNASKKYAEADPSEFTYSQSAGVNGETAGFAGRLERIAGEEVGHYAINQGSLVLADNGSFKAGNYTLSYVAGDFEIVNSDKLELTLAPYNNVYDGESHGIAVTKAVAGTEDVKLQYSKDGKTWQDDPITYKNVTNGAKTVYVKASAKGYDDKIVSETVTITPRTVQVTTPTQLKVYDTTPLTAEGRIEGIVEGETATFTTTGSQTEVGNSKNTYTLTWDGTAKETNYTVSESLGTLIVTPQSIVPDPDPENPSYKGVEVNTPADVPYNGQDQTWKPTVTDADGVALVNGQDYTVSYDKDDRTNVTGTITVTITGTGNYTGTVTRTYQITPKAVTITTKSDDKVYNGTPLTADGSVDGIVEGETYSFTVTGSQTWVGSSANTYEMVWATEDNHYTAKQSNYAVSENVGTLTITDGTPETPVDPSLVVNKTHDENQTYKAGDVITFTITVKNIYDEVKTITLAEQEGVTLDSEVFENVEPGKEITATATYTVTEADIVNGTFTNNVTARFSGVDKDYTGTDTVDEFEDPNPHMTITKTTKDVEENHIYKLGETIKYVITVTNDGNLTLTNVKVEDALTGNAGQNAWTIDTFAPGATQTFETSYTVTEADVLAGKVINNVTGTAKDPTNPDEPKTPVTPGEKEDPVEAPNPGLTVVKTSDTEGQVTLGQKITYTITVTNNGNVTISGVKLVDSLTGDNWTLGDIKPGVTVTKEATYTVTEKDIIAGKVENHATATGKDPSGKEITGKGEKTVTTEESNPHITVTKETTSTPKNGETYALGEEITYKITAKNTGNLTLTDVTVSDELTGNTGDKAFKIDGEFKPGDEKTFKTSYTVTEADLGKTVVNEATAAGKTIDPKNPEPGVTPGTTEDPVDQKKPGMSIEKKVIDQKEKYEIGDTVKYEITVTNTGNTTQKHILVEDQMSAAGQAVITKVDGANGTIDGAKVTLDTLAPGKAATITAEYTVVKADRGNTITNAAVAKGEGEIPKTPDVPVDVEDVYDIHVVHAFAPGNEGDVTLPADYTIENLKPGTTKDLIAEAVTGYVAYPGTQNATIIDGDITVTFLYYKDEIGTDPKNPDQPDGVPDEFQRVVRFAAVNGTVSIDHAVVTLYGEDGKPAKNGVGHLSAEQIAAATANTGYDQSSLSWSPATPTTSYDITNEMTFTATFTATPAVPNTPNTPDPPATPNPPATPSDNPGVLDRVVDTIKDVAADVQEVFSSDDGDVPLANQNLDEHKCCILHFLIMLLTAILYGFFTHNMKKRQKKNFELREELDTELVKRGLPTSKEQKNS